MMLSIGLFLMSMTDYYIPAISGSPFPVVGVALVWLTCQAFRGARGLETIFGCSILLGVIVGSWHGVADPSIEIWPTNLVGWFLGFAMLMIDLAGKQVQIERAFRIFLLIHVGFFFVQSFTYLVSDYYIDPLSWFTGESSRYLTEYATMSTSVFSMRPTGLFAEPSNYAAHVLPIALLYYNKQGRLSLLVAAALASAALTFSSWAFIAVALSLIFFINKDERNVFLVGGLGVFFVLFSGWFVTRTFEMPYALRSTAAELRWEFAESVLGNAVDLSPGLGIGVRDTVLVDLGNVPLNDSSVAIYLFYVFGVYALVLMIALFCAPSGWRNKVLLVLILTSKLAPTYPFFWLLINVITQRIRVPAARECRELTLVDSKHSEDGTAEAVRSYWTAPPVR